MQTDEAKDKTWEQEVIQKTLMAAYAEQRRARRWRIFFRFAFLAIFIAAVVAIWPNNNTPVGRMPHVALIDLKGEIFEDEPAGADMVATALRDAYEAEEAKAIILRVNSPGGSPVQGAYIFDEIMRLKAKYPEKKLYAVITDLGASAAYYAIAGADEIYANGSSLVGSIGVLLPIVGVSEAIQKIGVQQRSITAGKNKLFLDPLSPENEQQVAFAKALVDGVHQQFIDAVKQGRGDKLKNDPDIFSGLAWNGQQAMALGLVDALGSPGYVAREVIGIEEIVDYTVPQNLFEKFVGRLHSSFEHKLSTMQMVKGLQS